MPGVLFLVVFVSFFNVMAVLSIARLVSGVDFTAFIEWGSSRTLSVLLVFGPWTAVAYGSLKTGTFKHQFEEIFDIESSRKH